MARTLSWLDRIYSIRERVRASSLETWTRSDLEDIFEIKRVSAQNLMKAIGEVTNFGGKYFVSRTSLLSYLDELHAADDVEGLHRERAALAEPVARPRRLKMAIQEDQRSIMVADLPDTIQLEPGRVEIRGKDAEEVLQGLLLLAQALQNDLDTAQMTLSPPQPRPEVGDDEMRTLFRDLQDRWHARHGDTR